MSKIFSRDIRSTVEWSIVLCSIRGISREIQFSLSGASRIRQWNSKGKRDFESLPKGEKFFALPFLLPFFFSFSCFLSLSLSLFYGQRKIHFRKRLPPGYPGYFSLGGNWIFVVFLRPWIFFFFFSTYNHSYNWTYNTRRRSSDGTVRTTNTPSTPLPPTMEKARDKLTVRMNKIFSQSLSLLKNFLA